MPEVNHLRKALSESERDLAKTLVESLVIEIKADDSDVMSKLSKIEQAIDRITQKAERLKNIF